MIIFPTSTDRRLKRTPWVNYILIGLNVLVYLATYSDVALAHEYFYALEVALQTGSVIPQRPDILNFYLLPGDGSVLQYFTYQFLHSTPMHLAMNMVFLYVFGNAVEDRLGRFAYLCFYLGGGIVAGLGHGAAESNPVLGASGSVAAVTGAYLALFPLTNITLVYWFIVFGAFEVSGMILILFQVAQDILFQLGGTSGTAYLAHLAGYACGFTVGMCLLLTRVLDREPYDMLSMIQQRRRRAEFDKLTRDGRSPWASGKPGDPPPKGKAPEPTEDEQKLMRARTPVIEAITAHDLATAADRYVKLLSDHPGQVLSQQHQLDIANQLMSEGRYEASAGAYTLFLEAYRTYHDRQQVQLILGLIFARYLDKPEQAKTLLSEALPRLDGDNLTLAKQVLSEVDGAS